MNNTEKWVSGSTWSGALVLAAVAGCGGGSGDPILGAGVVAPLAAPTVTAIAPLANATSVPINTKILTAAFSAPMDPATLTTASFTLACAASAGAPLVNVTGGGAVTYSALDKTATLPLPAASNLPADAVCVANLSTAIKDAAGTALRAGFDWSFTTGLAPDNTAPFVSATGAYGASGATSGAAGLPINRNATVTFSEAMDPASICGPASLSAACPAASYTLVKTSDGSAVAGQVSYIGNTATFNPTGDLAANTSYTSRVTGGAKDLAGNALAATYVWSWATAAALDTSAPTITLTSPANLATNVAVNKTVSTSFSEEMKASTIVTSNYTVKETLSQASVAGTIFYDALSHIGTFSPQSNLKADTDYTVTVTAGATDLAGNALVVPAVNGVPKPNPWTFHTATAVVVPPLNSVNLGLASDFGIAATGGVTNTLTAPNTKINGNVVLSGTLTCNGAAVPGGLLTSGFGLCNNGAPGVSGAVYTPTYPDTTSANAVVLALRAAYLSITPPAGPPAAGTLGGGTVIPAGTTLGAAVGSAPVVGDNVFFPGVYTSSTSILISGDLTLDAQGDPNARFVFQSASTVGAVAGSIGAHTRILLINGAKASNVWWQAGSAATLGTHAEWQGNILAAGSITMETNATSCGRLFAGAFTTGAFVLDSNVISVPGSASAPASCR
jgi:hypothetical protein